MDLLTWAIVVTVLVLGTAVLLFRRLLSSDRAASKDFEVRRREFLSKREMEAFRLLLPIAAGADLHVCPQASMDSFLKFEGQGGFRERGRYKARRSDFAMMDRTGAVVLVVEIDDASHRGHEEQDEARDEVVRMAGIPTVRIPAGRLPHVGEMQRMLGRAFPGIIRGR